MTNLTVASNFKTPVPTKIPVEALAPPVGTIRDLLAREGGDPVEIIRQKLREMGSIQSQALLAADRDVIGRRIKADQWPLPAARDRQGYYGEDHLSYWAMGLADAHYCSQLITDRVGKGPETPVTVVDLGAASGRVLRHLAMSRPGSTMIGTDINANNVNFLRSYLGDLLIPVHNAIYPPLPLADSSVDFLYALSVFTHIDDFEEAWIMEIKRILKPGGYAFLTVHTERTWTQLKPGHFLHDLLLRGRHSAKGLDYFIPQINASYFRTNSFGHRAAVTNLDRSVNNAITFHNRDYLTRRWGHILPIVEFLEDAHGRHQDAVLLAA